MTNSTANRTAKRRAFSRTSLVLVGAFAVPLLITLLCNEYGAQTEAGAIRMAFATVAGQTIAILTAIALIVMTLTRHRSAGPIVGGVLVAAVIVALAVGTMIGAGDVMLQRLDRIAEVGVPGL